MPTTPVAPSQVFMWYYFPGLLFFLLVILIFTGDTLYKAEKSGNWLLKYHLVCLVLTPTVFLYWWFT